MSEMKVPLGVSARHIHLSKEDLGILFGVDYELHEWKPLKQKGQYAAEEKVDVITEKGSFKGVRVLGPLRKQTQLEIAQTDAVKLGLKPPVRDSGDLAGSEKVKIVGPKGEIDLKEGVIVAWRHIHMSLEDAENFAVKDKDYVKVEFLGDRSLIFEKVLIRVHKDFILEMHIDTDEANASLSKSGDLVSIVK